MAFLYLSEYSATTVRGVQTAKAPPIATQKLAIGAVVNSNPFSGTTELVRVAVDAVCSVRWGTAPVATTSDERWAANQTEWRAVAPGDQLSVISNT